MQFPEYDRVIYDKNPLAAVICQLRFPTILSIEQKPPADFQERIRQDYPVYREKRGGELAHLVQSFEGSNLPFDLPSFFGGVKIHEFWTEEETWSVSLTKDYLSLSTTRYERWEDFRLRLEKLFLILLDVYQVPYFTRVGLRYQDILRRNMIGLDNIHWSELIKSPIAGLLAIPDIESSVGEYTVQTLIGLDEPHSQVRMWYGFAQVPDSKEICFVVDSDFFKDDKTEKDNALTILDNYHQQAGRLFRWCITDTLHAAMHPHPV
jgi:uncharacterized protein (TIGR04255 family)